jgi:hypothetical protein
MPFPLAAGLGLQLGSSLLSGLFGDDAAKERERAIQTAINALGEGRSNARELLDPRLDQERRAMGRVNALLGLTDEGADFDVLRNTPGYQFRLEEGSRARERSAAARGGLNSGNTLLELERYGQGLADTTFDNYLDRVLGLESQGVDASLADLEYGYGRDVGNLAIGKGEARASGSENWGNALIGGLQGVSGMLVERNRTNALLDLYRGVPRGTPGIAPGGVPYYGSGGYVS